MKIKILTNCRVENTDCIRKDPFLDLEPNFWKEGLAGGVIRYRETIQILGTKYGDEASKFPMITFLLKDRDRQDSVFEGSLFMSWLDPDFARTLLT